MNTQLVTASPPPAPQDVQASTRVQEATAYQAEKVDLSYTDDQGRAYTVHISRETAAYAQTYDASARLGGRSGRAALPADTRDQTRELMHDIKDLKHELKDLRHDLEDAFGERGKEARHEVKELTEALKDVEQAVNGFKNILKRFLHHSRGDHHGPRDRDTESEGPPFPAIDAEAHGAYLAVAQTVTVEIEVTGAVAEDPWSVANTAGRLVEFAMGLFQGGDRTEHAEKMAEGMDRGYREARAEFGGILPDIAQDTVDLAKEMLAQWAEGNQATQTEETEGVRLVA